LKLWDLIGKFQSQGGTILLTTHYMEEAARLCDRVAIMDHGKVIALDTPNALVESLGADEIVEFSLEGFVTDGDLSRLPGVRGVRSRNGSYLLTVSSIGAALTSLLAEVDRHEAKLVGLTTHRATLEDVFVNLTGRKLRDA
jgi:ABC-2 type transport system ATP-binding protein